MASFLATPDSKPIVISVAPSPQPASKKSNGIDDKIEDTIFDLKKYRWDLIAIAIILVVFLLTWWFWGRRNNNTNVVRIGGGKIAKKFVSGCSS